MYPPHTHTPTRSASDVAAWPRIACTSKNHVLFKHIGKIFLSVSSARAEVGNGAMSLYVLKEKS